jgi:hypothetical protein
VTFSDSTTPESGSPSISSPGPGIARLSAERSNTFSLDADFLIAGFFDALDDSDRIELGQDVSDKPPETETVQLSRTRDTRHATRDTLHTTRDGTRPPTSSRSWPCRLPLA